MKIKILSIIFCLFSALIIFGFVAPKNTSAYSCTYSFPHDVTVGNVFTVTVSSPDFSHGYQIGIINSAGDTVITENLFGPGSKEITAPSPGGTYTLLVGDVSPGGGLCAGNSTLNVSNPTTSCLINPTSRAAGENFNVGGLGFDPTVSYHSVSMTGYFPTPENTFNNLALMSYNPSTGAWSATVTIPSTAPPGDYIVRVDSTQCYPKLSVTESAGINDGTSGTVECDSFIGCVADFTKPPGYETDGFVGTLVSRFLPIAIAFGGFLAVIFIVISGIQFITSSGNPEGAAAARGRLTFAIVGFVLLVLAFMITRVVDMVFLRGSGVF